MDGPLTGIAPRQLTAVLARRLAEEPALVLNGPRTVGKSTLLHALAGRLGRFASKINVDRTLHHANRATVVIVTR